MIREFPLLNLNFRRFSETASSQQTSKNNQGQDAGGVIGMIPVQEPIHLWLRGSGRLSSHWWSENQQYTAILLYWCVYCVYIHIYIIITIIIISIIIIIYICILYIYREREKDCYFVIIDWFPESHMTHFPLDCDDPAPWPLGSHMFSQRIRHPPWWDISCHDSLEKNPKIIIGSLICH